MKREIEVFSDIINTKHELNDDVLQSFEKELIEDCNKLSKKAEDQARYTHICSSYEANRIKREIQALVRKIESAVEQEVDGGTVSVIDKKAPFKLQDIVKVESTSARRIPRRLSTDSG